MALVGVLTVGVYVLFWTPWITVSAIVGQSWVSLPEETRIVTMVISYIPTIADQMMRITAVPYLGHKYNKLYNSFKGRFTTRV